MLSHGILLTLAVHGLKELFFCFAIVSVFWLWQEIVFGVTYIPRVRFKMACRNWNSEGTDDGQMSPHGYPNF